MKRYKQKWMYFVSAGGYFLLAAGELIASMLEIIKVEYPLGYLFAFILFFLGLVEIYHYKKDYNKL